jgi:hypothetical protein
MKKKLNLLVMLVSLLALSLAFIGCEIGKAYDDPELVNITSGSSQNFGPFTIKPRENDLGYWLIVTVGGDRVNVNWAADEQNFKSSYTLVLKYLDNDDSAGYYYLAEE